MIISVLKKIGLVANHKDGQVFLQQLKLGDEKAYGHLADLYYSKLCVYANSLVNDVLLAEDIVQNVFIKFWKRRQQLKIEHSLQGLLYKAVYNEFIDQYRKKQVLIRVEENYHKHLNAITHEYDEVKINKTIQLIYKVVETLPPKCREVFLLSKKNGMTNMEIAEHLNTSIKTIETHMSNAFKKIRKKLNPNLSDIFFFLFGFKEKSSSKVLGIIKSSKSK